MTHQLGIILLISFILTVVVVSPPHSSHASWCKIVRENAAALISLYLHLFDMCFSWMWSQTNLFLNYVKEAFCVIVVVDVYWPDFFSLVCGWAVHHLLQEVEPQPVRRVSPPQQQCECEALQCGVPWEIRGRSHTHCSTRERWSEGHCCKLWRQNKCEDFLTGRQVAEQ